MIYFVFREFSRGVKYRTRQWTLGAANLNFQTLAPTFKNGKYKQIRIKHGERLLFRRHRNDERQNQVFILRNSFIHFMKIQILSLSLGIIVRRNDNGMQIVWGFIEGKSCLKSVYEYGLNSALRVFWCSSIRSRVNVYNTDSWWYAPWKKFQEKVTRGTIEQPIMFRTISLFVTR